MFFSFFILNGWCFKQVTHPFLRVLVEEFGTFNGQIASFLIELSATGPYFHFRMITLVNVNGFSPN